LSRSLDRLDEGVARAVSIRAVIAKNDRDIALFRHYIVQLTGQQGTRHAISSLERWIAMAEKSNAILRSTIL
jgi:hypothetical protein